MTQEIASELVANVAQVHVVIGQRVAAGEELVLLESMKMEIPMLAEAAGTVSDVRCSPGGSTASPRGCPWSSPATWGRPCPPAGAPTSAPWPWPLPGRTASTRTPRWRW